MSRRGRRLAKGGIVLVPRPVAPSYRLALQIGGGICYTSVPVSLVLRDRTNYRLLLECSSEMKVKNVAASVDS